MKKLTQLNDSELISARGGGPEDDSFARDLGQYTGGFFGAYAHNQFLSSLPLFGVYAAWCGIEAAMN